MTLVFALLLVLVVVVAILRGLEVRLTLILGALALGGLAGKPMSIVRKFLQTLTEEKFLLPIGCCMGFAYVLRSTECDRHLIHLLLKPLQRVRTLLIPGIILIGVLVNVPIISQTSTAIAVGSVLVPVLTAARLSPTTVGAALALGASIGGELLNPGAPELRSVSSATGQSSIECVAYVWPLLLVHLAVTVPLFWLMCLWAESRGTVEKQPAELHDDFRVNPFKAMVPMIPLVLLLLTAMPEQVRLISVPPEWLVTTKDKPDLFDSRLIGSAMLVGVVIAALSSPSKAGSTAKVFFEGVGAALTNITALIVAASCFGEGVRQVGLVDPLKDMIETSPRLLMPLAALFPLSFAWVSGSGMAATEALFKFYVEPAQTLEVDPLSVGAVVSLSAATGRTLSPVAAVVLMSASLTGAKPLDLVRRMAPPMLAGLLVMVVFGMLRS